MLVHGGWHGAWAWDKTAILLEAAGDVAITPTLPAHGSDTTPFAQATLDGYVQAVVAAIDAQSEDVVLVGHSMAGAVVSMAAEARPDRVRLLVYLAAVLLEDGKSVTSVTATDPESVLGKHLVFNADATLSIDPSYAAESLYGDCSQADADAAVTKLGKEPLGPLDHADSRDERCMGERPADLSPHARRQSDRTLCTDCDVHEAAVQERRRAADQPLAVLLRRRRLRRKASCRRGRERNVTLQAKRRSGTLSVRAL